jgi:nucleotide-binding universal stress UspA family protein
MKVIIATDGSEFSVRAVEEFCRLFPNSSNDQIKVVSVCETYPIAAEPFAVSAEYYQQISDAAEKEAGHYASSSAAILRERRRDGDLDLGVEVLHGSPAREIIHLAEGWEADLIVVGSHGRGFWGRLLGSVSNAVVHNAPCSVLVVKGSEGSNR